MNFLSLVLNINLCIYLSSAEIKEEDGIMVLTEKNFDNVVTKDVDILVEFFRTDCERCQLLAPEYVKLAKLLKDEQSPVKIAKIDVEKEQKLVDKRFKISTVPEIKLFKKGKDINYNDGANVADHILAWIHKKTGQVTKLLNSIEDYENFLQSKQVAVVGFFPVTISSEVKAFKKAAENSYIEFGITHKQEVAGKAKVLPKDPSIVLYKKYDAPEIRYDGKYNADKIITFINKESVPLILDTADQTTDLHVVESEITEQVYLISNKTAPNYKEMYDNFKAVAPLYKGKVLFLYADLQSETSLEIMEMANLTEVDLPAVRVINRSNESTALSYKPETKEKLTPGIISDFIQTYLDGKLIPYFTWKEPTEDEAETEGEPEGSEEQGAEGEQEEEGKQDAEGGMEGAEENDTEGTEEQDTERGTEGAEEQDTEGGTEGAEEQDTEGAEEQDTEGGTEGAEEQDTEDAGEQDTEGGTEGDEEQDTEGGMEGAEEQDTEGGMGDGEDLEEETDVDESSKEIGKKVTKDEL